MSEHIVDPARWSWSEEDGIHPWSLWCHQAPKCEPIQTPPNLPEPCRHCGWQYDDERLIAAARGEMTLDPMPTHLCRPNEVSPDA